MNCFQFDNIRCKKWICPTFYTVFLKTSMWSIFLWVYNQALWWFSITLISGYIKVIYNRSSNEIIHQTSISSESKSWTKVKSGKGIKFSWITIKVFFFFWYLTLIFVLPSLTFNFRSFLNLLNEILKVMTNKINLSLTQNMHISILDIVYRLGMIMAFEIFYNMK